MPAPRWYCARGDQVLGPFEIAELRQMVAAGTLGRADQVCPEGQSRWLPAASIPGLFTAPPPPLPSAVPKSGAAPQQPAGGNDAPMEPWRPVAAHGSTIGRWSAVVSVALLGLYVAASHPQKLSDRDFWAGWVCFGFFMGGAGYWVGHAVGFVVGRNTDKPDVARAVTATATIAFFLCCLGMAAVYMTSTWREQRAEAPKTATSPPAESRHRGRTTLEWIGMYQKRDAESWKEATAALKAIGTVECVAAYVRELEAGGFDLDKRLDAIRSLEELAARGQRTTRTALPTLQRIASRQPGPDTPSHQMWSIRMSADAAAKAVRAIQALE